MFKSRKQTQYSISFLTVPKIRDPYLLLSTKIKFLNINRHYLNLNKIIIKIKDVYILHKGKQRLKQQNLKKNILILT